MRDCSITFFGIYFAQEDETRVLKVSKRGVPYAHQLFQNRLLQGFQQHLHADKCFSITSWPAGIYPSNSRLLLYPTLERTILDSIPNVSIGFLNLPLVKELCRWFGARRAIRNNGRLYSSQKLGIVVYDLNIALMLSALRLRKQLPNSRTCLVVPDLPGSYGMDSGRTGFAKLAEKLMSSLQLKIARRFDTYALLTKQMADIVNVDVKPQAIVEAISEDDSSNDIAISNASKKAFMYAGWVKQEYNINKMIEAFMRVQDQEIELWICGNCDYQDVFLDLISKDRRIKYFGPLPKREVTRLSSEVIAYINPRTNNGRYTAYSFPSKTLEALEEGVPLICYKLEGIPSEYDQFLVYPEDESVDALARAMQDIVSMERNTRAQFIDAGKRFSRNNKRPYHQSAKIVKLLFDLEEGKTRHDDY